MGRKHTHKYERIDQVWYCGLVGCPHYMPKNVKGGSVEGRPTICWSCKQEFMLTKNSMRRDRPICPDCYVAEVNKEREAAGNMTIEQETEWAEQNMIRMGLVKGVDF